MAFLKEVNEAVYALHPGATMIAEESTAWPGVSRPDLSREVSGSVSSGTWGGCTTRWTTSITIPCYRRYHHGELTFGLIYAWSENFVLPLSHDEVVHGKGSLLNKMPGDRWQQLANLRALYAWMWAHPGKQLLFMGGELGQERRVELASASSTGGSSTSGSTTAGCGQWWASSTASTAAQPALWAQDFRPEGFSLGGRRRRDQSVLSFLRLSARGRPATESVACVANLTPCPPDRAIGWAYPCPAAGGAAQHRRPGVGRQRRGQRRVGCGRGHAVARPPLVGGHGPTPARSALAGARGTGMTFTDVVPSRVLPVISLTSCGHTRRVGIRRAVGGRRAGGSPWLPSSEWRPWLGRASRSVRTRPTTSRSEQSGRCKHNGFRPPTQPGRARSPWLGRSPRLAASLVLYPSTGTSGVAPDTVVTVSASKGTLRSVGATDATGRALAGHMVDGGTSWKSVGPLEIGTVYQVKAEVATTSGVTVSKSSTFKVLVPTAEVAATVFPTTDMDVGVGQPIVVTFDQPIYTAASQRTVLSHLTISESKPVPGGWHWFSPYELHFRPESYWPAGEQISVSGDLDGWNAGSGEWGAGVITDSFGIGDARISYANLQTDEMTVTLNGKVVAVYPISGGDPSTRRWTAPTSCSTASRSCTWSPRRSASRSTRPTATTSTSTTTCTSPTAASTSMPPRGRSTPRGSPTCPTVAST